MAIRDALKHGPFDLRDLAKDTGLSYSTIQAYAYGKRTPSDESTRRVALALLERAARLVSLANEVSRTT